MRVDRKQHGTEHDTVVAVELAAEVLDELFGCSLRAIDRASILQRLFSHEAYHCGELSQTLGIAGLPQIDLWRSD